MAYRKFMSSLVSFGCKTLSIRQCNYAKLTPIACIRNMSTTNTFTWKHIKPLTGLNRPNRFFKPGEEDIHNMLDEEKRLAREQRSLLRLDKFGYRIKRKRKNPIDGRPQIKGIVLRTLIKKPKKPNSANRKCVLVRLSNGKEKTCFVPGIGHNLQEHSRVLIRYHRVKDVPGLKLRVIRGVYDCSQVIKQKKT